MIQQKVVGLEDVLNIAEELKKAKKMVLEVGLPRGSGIYPTGETVVSIGAIHEFGSSTIPRRSFLRVPFIDKQKDIDSTIVKAYRSVGEGKSTSKNALGKVGVYAVNISKGSFTTKGYGKWTDIKPATKRKKGSSQVLLDTGQLRNSISWRIS